MSSDCFKRLIEYGIGPGTGQCLRTSPDIFSCSAAVKRSLLLSFHVAMGQNLKYLDRWGWLAFYDTIIFRRLFGRWLEHLGFDPMYQPLVTHQGLWTEVVVIIIVQVTKVAESSCSRSAGSVHCVDIFASKYCNFISECRFLRVLTTSKQWTSACQVEVRQHAFLHLKKSPGSKVQRLNTIHLWESKLIAIRCPVYITICKY